MNWLPSWLGTNINPVNPNAGLLEKAAEIKEIQKQGRSYMTKKHLIGDEDTEESARETLRRIMMDKKDEIYRIRGK